jgi:hypothetical protein
MRRMCKIGLASGLCIVALAAFGTTSAFADDSIAADDGQLLDVSKQVANIQEKLDQLIAQGEWARPGKLLAGADCGYPEPSQIFLPWGDDASYALAPQGDLSAIGGWSLNKQARVASVADPFSGAFQSLQLGKGAEAATPAMCVNADNPTIRFFTRDVGGNGKANLKLDVLYEAFDGKVKHLTIARTKAGSDWQPSIVVPMHMNILAAASPDGITAVAFKFKAEGLQKDETLFVSSLYVDPYCSR